MRYIKQIRILIFLNIKLLLTNFNGHIKTFFYICTEYFWFKKEFIKVYIRNIRYLSKKKKK